MQLAEIAANEYASALLSLCVVGDKPKSTLTLVPEGFELGDQVVGTCREILERYDADTALLIAFD